MSTSSAFATRKGPSKTTAPAAAANELEREVAVVATIAYPSLIDPDEQSGKRMATFIIDADEPTLEDLRELVYDHFEAMNGKREAFPKQHNPLREGDEIAANGGFSFKHPSFRGGKCVIKAKSNYIPACVTGEERTPIDASQVRGGDKVVVALKGYHFSNASTGVALALNGIWKIADGDVRIERGGSGGSSFGKIDTSRIRFSKPKNSPEEF